MKDWCVNVYRTLADCMNCQEVGDIKVGLRRTSQDAGRANTLTSSIPGGAGLEDGA